MKRFLFIHSGTDLYGSDRMLLFVMETVRAVFPGGYLEVWIPGPGALSLQIARDFPEAEVRYEPTAVLRRYDLKRFNFGALFRLAIFPRWIRKLSAFDFILVNTIVIWDVLLALRFVKGRKVVYVHESPEGLSRRIFRWFLRWSGAERVFVSHAVQASVWVNGDPNQRVIWNGCKAVQVAPPQSGGEPRNLHLLQLGRISAVKGQELLLDALALLPRNVRKCIDIRIVGDVFGRQEALMARLYEKIVHCGMEDQVSFHPFSSPPDAHFAWADGIVVPSVFPEPFGLVAIEAMSTSRPVIAAAHGGLLEIVEDGVSGWLFLPGDAEALSHLLWRAATMDRGTFLGLGDAGRRRYESFFSEERCRHAWIELLEEKKVEV